MYQKLQDKNLQKNPEILKIKIDSLEDGFSTYV